MISSCIMHDVVSALLDDGCWSGFHTHHFSFFPSSWLQYAIKTQNSEPASSKVPVTDMQTTLQTSKVVEAEHKQDKEGRSVKGACCKTINFQATEKPLFLCLLNSQEKSPAAFFKGNTRDPTCLKQADCNDEPANKFPWC